MSIRRNHLASDQGPAPAARNPLRGPGTADTSPRSASDLAGGRCEQATSHPTQYPPLHELAHALTALEREDEDPELSYAAEELVVESVAFTVSGSIGLDTIGESVPYLASWAQSAPLETIEATAKLIDRLARRIEDALESAARAAEAQQDPCEGAPQAV